MHIPEDKLKQFIVRRMMYDPKLVNFLMKYDGVDLIGDPFGELIGSSIVDLYQLGGKLAKPSSVVNKARTKLDEANRRVEVYSSAEFEQYVKKVGSIKKDEIEDIIFYDSVIDFIQRKGCYRSITNAIDLTSDNDPELQRIIPEFEKYASVTLEDEIGFDFYQSQEILWDDILNEEAMIPTGINMLDDKIGGGVCRNGKGLWVFLGQPNVGKSLMLSNIAVNMDAMGIKVGIMSLEMSELMYSKRCLAHITQHNINRFVEGKGENRRDHKHRLTDYVKAHHAKSGGDIIIKEFPPSSMNCRDIKRYLELLRENDRMPEVLFVDYLGLVIPNIRSNEGSHWRIGEVCKELRALSFEFEIPIITAAQLNGEGYDTDEITMANVAESKAINMHADFMGALYQLDGDMQQGTMNMKILKSRFGSRTENKVVMAINYESLKISNIGVEDYNQRNCEDLLEGESYREVGETVLTPNELCEEE